MDAITDHQERTSLIERYRLIARRHRDRVVKAGQSLLAGATSEAQALATLEKQAAELKLRAEADAARIMADV